MHTNSSTHRGDTATYTQTGISSASEIGRREIIAWIRFKADRDTCAMLDMAIMEAQDRLHDDEPLVFPVLSDIDMDAVKRIALHV